MDFIDVTYTIDEKLLIYPGDPAYESTSHLSIEKGELCNVARFSMGCHTGTHMDAPLHFVEGGASIDLLDLGRFNGPARVIEYTGSGDISVDFLERCHIMPRERILFKTSNSMRFGGRTLLEDYVAIDAAAARYLVQCSVECIGIDYLTIEPADSTDGSVHKTILGAGIPVIETLDLRRVPSGDYELYCLPLRLGGLDGSPARVLLRRSETHGATIQP